jgi:hypothetical protein
LFSGRKKKQKEVVAEIETDFIKKLNLFRETYKKCGRATKPKEIVLLNIMAPYRYDLHSG